MRPDREAEMRRHERLGVKTVLLHEGLVYVKLDNAWQVTLGRELHQAGTTGRSESAALVSMERPAPA